MRVLNREDRPTDLEFSYINLEKRNRALLFNAKASKHGAKYCNKKCPSGQPSAFGWLDEGGVCEKCEFNPYNMEEE